MKNVIGYGFILGVLIAGLKWIEYSFLIRNYAIEIYGGILAVLFTVVGIWLGLKLTRKKEVIVIKEVPVIRPAEFILDEAKLRKLSISRREYEILTLIAEGYSNQEIADKLFVSPNTVKTHSSNLFSKLDVSRRTQAVQRAKSLGLIP